MEKNKGLELCSKYGVHKAAIIDVERITFDKGLRANCEMNQCGCYKTNYGCPPYIGESQELISEAKQYKKALVYQTVYRLTDSYDVEGMKEAMLKHSEIANKIEAEITQSIGKHLDLRAGPCVACDTCAAIDHKPCKHPEKKKISLEAYCINVSDLAEQCAMNYINGTNTVTYFGAFLFDHN